MRAKMIGACLGLTAILGLAAPYAFAAGKPGLWSVTITTNIAGMQQPQLSPEQLAQMKRMGITMPDMSQPRTIRHCVTPEEAARTEMRRPEEMQQDCHVENQKVRGRSMSADLVCTGSQMNGKGHIETTYDSDEHYSSKMWFKGMSSERPIDMTSTTEGQWLSAQC